MDPLKRNNPGVRATNHEDRIQTLERRYADDFPQWGSMLCDPITESAAGSYEFTAVFPGDDPCDLPDCDIDDWYQSTNHLLLPTGYQSILEIFMTFGLQGGNSNLDDYYTTVDAADQSINGQCRVRVQVEVWRDNAPFGSLSGRAYSTWNEHPPPTGGFSPNRLWTHHTLVANNGTTFNAERDRFALKPMFDINQALPGVIQVSGSMAVNIQPMMQRLGGYGDIGA